MKNSATIAPSDGALPLEVRIVGALIRLYALPVSRIVEITADQFHRDHDAAFLILGKNPVVLPPKLAALIEKQIVEPRYTSMVRQQADHLPRFLLPGSHQASAEALGPSAPSCDGTVCPHSPPATQP